MASFTGWLEKEGKNGFQRRYFVLEGTSLMYYYTSACTGKCHRAELSGGGVSITNTKSVRPGRWPFWLKEGR